jgi:TolB-like protein
MQANEAATLAALKSRRAEILQPMVSKHHGRIVKVMGDGVLVEFASAVDAVCCAVALQEAMAVANENAEESQRVVLRIGINLGDVMVEGGDLYGDGVNIASRLEGISRPGGIYVSSKVREEVAGKVSCEFVDLGEHRLKNIAQPNRVYMVSPAGTTADRPISPPLAGSRQPSIAVLPFTNVSGDAEQQYLSDGVTEDIITELSRYRELMVIARNSSFQFRQPSVDMKVVGRELGADYLVEGSLRKIGDRLRISAQLIEAVSGSHVWAERYDRNLNQVFEIQDEIAQTIAATLVGQVARGRTDNARRTPTNNWNAYDYVLQGLQCINGFEPKRAEAFLQRAIQIDSDYAHAHALLAAAYLNQFYESEEDHLLSASFASAKRAVQLDNDNPYAHCQVAWALIFLGKLDEAEVHLDRAILLNPNSIWCAGSRAGWLFRVGRIQESLATLDTIARRDPFFPAWCWEVRCTALFTARRYEEAIMAARRKQILQYWDHAYLAAAYSYLGLDQEAQAEVAEVLRKRPGFTIRGYAKQEPYKNQTDRDHLLEGMRKAGLPE